MSANTLSLVLSLSLSSHLMANIFNFDNEHLDVLAIMGMNFNGKMFRDGRLIQVGELFYGSIFAEISALLGPTDPIGNAARKFINKTEVVRSESKYISFKNGAISSVVGNPNRITSYGSRITLDWMVQKTVQGRVRNRLERSDGPARVIYDDGILSMEEWHFEGALHNPNGPAKICYNPDGSIFLTEFYIHGELHRVGGPAHTLIQDGVTRTEYRQHDQLHRIDGPAYIVTGADGVEREGGWYAHGEFINA